MKISERVEEYLEALWIAEEKGMIPTKINWISDKVGVSPPSAVEILKKMEKNGYLEYKRRKGIKLKEKGRKIGKQIIRNHRLIETLMEKTLDQDIDEEVACGIEHHMTRDFANALCTELDHPRKCPHGNPIPRGQCCPT